MNVIPFLEPHPQPAELVKPRQSALNYPAIPSQTAAMLCASFANERHDGMLAQLYAERLRIIPAVPLDDGRFSQGPTPLAADRWNCFHQRQQLGHVVPIRLRDTDRKGNPLSFSDDMVFCALFPAIRGVRPRFRPPNTALTEELSTTAREKSILSAPRSRARSTSWIFCQAPSFCQACRYRQQLIPEPQPNSCGNISQGIPLRNTYKIPTRARRRSMGFRPGLRNLRGLGGGSNGSISFHRSSGTRSSTFIVPSQLRTTGSISVPNALFNPLC
jgi:hypothetical protein